MKKSNLMVVIIVTILVMTGLAIGLSSIGNDKKASVTPISISPAPGSTRVYKPNSEQNPHATNSVLIRAGTFVPRFVKIKPGSKITWTNTDLAARTILSEGEDGDTIESPVINLGDIYSLSFEKPGTYTYHSGQDSKRTGTIIVSN